MLIPPRIVLMHPILFAFVKRFYILILIYKRGY